MHSAAESPSARPEAVIFCGIQASGKTTFYNARFAATHERINLDELRTRRREHELLMSCLAGSRSFVVDNTNPTPEERAAYVRPALEHGFRVVAFWLEALPRQALARNAAREGRARIPVPGILGTYKRLQVPALDEGFEAVYRVISGDDERFLVTPLAMRGAGRTPGRFRAGAAG